jgi:hypothetical protein
MMLRCAFRDQDAGSTSGRLNELAQPPLRQDQLEGRVRKDHPHE